MKHLIPHLHEFKKKNIVVIGDLMLDKYILGKVERISPEAPVPIVYVEKENYVPGGAANAACNVASLTGNAFLAGIVGNDIAKDILLDESKNRFINTDSIIVDNSKPTIQKIRVLGQSQQLLRIDYENKEYASAALNAQLFDRIKKIPDIDGIIISDYAKGTISKNLLINLKRFMQEKKIPLIVDPKPKHKNLYKDVSLITPNKKEAEAMTGLMIDTKEDLEKAGQQLIKDLNCNVLITTGEKGMSLFEKSGTITHIPTVAKEVFDVSGAGDTVIATLALALCSRLDLKESALLANYAAGIKVAKLGTASVSLDELKNSLTK